MPVSKRIRELSETSMVCNAAKQQIHDKTMNHSMWLCALYAVYRGNIDCLIIRLGHHSHLCTRQN